MPATLKRLITWCWKEYVCIMVQMLGVLVRPYKSGENFQRISGKPWFSFATLTNSWFVTWTLKINNMQRWGPLLRTRSFQELEGSSKSPCKKKEQIKCQSGQHLLSFVKKVHQLLGFTSYYQCFVCKFATIAKPLYRLAERRRHLLWTKKCSETFTTLKLV